MGLGLGVGLGVGVGLGFGVGVGLGVGLGFGVGLGPGLGVGLGLGVGVGTVVPPPLDDVEGVVATSEEDGGVTPAPPPHPVMPRIPTKTASNLLSALRENRKMSLQVGVPTRTSG